MQFTNILWTLIAGAWYGTSSPAPDGNCSSASDNIALIQRQASVQAHAADPSPKLTSVESAGALWISANNGGTWGTWGSASYCPGDNPIVGVQQKVEGNQGGGDDTAMNAVRFLCRGGTWLTSTEGVWGGWSPVVQCTGSGYMTAYQMLSESPQGGGDDTAANRIIIYCSNGAWLYPTGGMGWGSWKYAACPSGMYARGFHSKVEGSQGGGDDTALNGINVYCQSTPAPTPYPTTANPTLAPTNNPTNTPTITPTDTPTNAPTTDPTPAPTRPEHGCASWCSKDSREWSAKCGWNVCYECSECGTNPGPCKQWCYHDSRPWSTKCSYKETCGECEPCE